MTNGNNSLLDRISKRKSELQKGSVVTNDLSKINDGFTFGHREGSIHDSITTDVFNPVVPFEADSNFEDVEQYNMKLRK